MEWVRAITFKKIKSLARFEILTAKMSMFFWIVTPRIYESTRRHNPEDSHLG
jgi:hypothetical protein